MFSFANGLLANSYKGNVPYGWYSFVKGITIFIDFILFVVIVIFVCIGLSNLKGITSI